MKRTFTVVAAGALVALAAHCKPWPDPSHSEDAIRNAAGGIVGKAVGVGAHEADCGNGCTDLDFDNSNCGACGNVCGSLQQCYEGACIGLEGGLSFEAGFPGSGSGAGGGSSGSGNPGPCAQDCAEFGDICLVCGGEASCEPPGSTCYGGALCPAGSTITACGCAAPSAVCCGSTYCELGDTCVTCGPFETPVCQSAFESACALPGDDGGSEAGPEAGDDGGLEGGPAFACDGGAVPTTCPEFESITFCLPPDASCL